MPLAQSQSIQIFLNRMGLRIGNYSRYVNVLSNDKNFRVVVNFSVENANSPSSGVTIPTMIPIEGGTFMMGSHEDSDEEPIHEVFVNSFEMSETEITFIQYDFYVSQNGGVQFPDDEGNGRGNLPVGNLSWEDAKGYCDWLSRETGQTYRLPTEAEWEFAAGGGVSSRNYYAGTDTGDSLRWYANYKGENEIDAFDDSAPVKYFIPNSLGLYDMTGNVYEWCLDWYDRRYYEYSLINNPKGPSVTNTGEKVIRGGSYEDNRRDLRVSNRHSRNFRSSSLDVGFRIVREL